ncbi:MAG: hypothetical protein J6U07_05550 [Fibrobacter sp.]|jgi:hypothetical protein|uniref:hypothetical protein n=1 Tax=Fibrobacter sp. UWP2 TaxID=1896216 RepID=UPI000919BFB1|nr:hypothetical protein [Fibrobacter sp. UWP2]MBO7384053.1 hypothetical protein [Fibrobacter sp.]SHI95964.1 hypothetical protein SAMN05720471_11212 [Fibrobacter sp. UWP2]
MANNDFDDVRLHATQTFAAVERQYNKIGRGKRLLIKGGVCLLFFIGGFITCSVMNDVPTEGVIEKIAAQPDLKNKCKGRYDRPMEYAIMHECIFAKGTPSNEKKLVQRINYCTCALQSVQAKKPYQKMFENNLVDFTFKIREEDLCQDDKVIPTLDPEDGQKK